MTDGLQVALNAHLMSGQAGYRRAGVNRYIHELVRHLGQLGDGLRLTVLASGTTVVPANERTVVRSRWPTHRVPLRILWEQIVQPRVLRRTGVDVVHGPVYVGPLAASCPLVITIHDLSFIRHPNLLRPGSRMYLTLFTRLSARRATRIIAVSKHAALETASLLGVAASQIDVVYHGVGEAFRPLPSEAVEAFRRERGLPDRFVLYLGTLEPRKNLPRLVESFDQARERTCSLVLAGGAGWGAQGLRDTISNLGLTDRVIFVGYVADAELPLLYNAATVFAYPSLYEGFGLPVLEAQACGTAVLTSNSSSLPESAGDAAMMVDPRSVEEMARALAVLLSDSSLRQDLRTRGLAHARRFDWRRTAEQTASVYSRAVADGSFT